MTRYTDTPLATDTNRAQHTDTGARANRRITVSVDVVHTQHTGASGRLCVRVCGSVYCLLGSFFSFLSKVRARAAGENALERASKQQIRARFDD